jgi:hypothetical protein
MPTDRHQHQHSPNHNQHQPHPQQEPQRRNQPAQKAQHHAQNYHTVLFPSPISIASWFAIRPMIPLFRVPSRLSRCSNTRSASTISSVSSRLISILTCSHSPCHKQAGSDGEPISVLHDTKLLSTVCACADPPPPRTIKGRGTPACPTTTGGDHLCPESGCDLGSPPVRRHRWRRPRPSPRVFQPIRPPP